MLATKLFNYIFKINGEEYKALFLTEKEALDFYTDNLEEGNDIVTTSVSALDLNGVLALKNEEGYDIPYLVEMVSTMVMTEEVRKDKKVDMLERMLNELGYKF